MQPDAVQQEQKRDACEHAANRNLDANGTPEFGRYMSWRNQQKPSIWNYKIDMCPTKTLYLLC